MFFLDLGSRFLLTSFLQQRGRFVLCRAQFRIVFLLSFSYPNWTWRLFVAWQIRPIVPQRQSTRFHDQPNGRMLRQLIYCNRLFVVSQAFCHLSRFSQSSVLLWRNSHALKRQAKKFILNYQLLRLMYDDSMCGLRWIEVMVRDGQVD